MLTSIVLLCKKLLEKEEICPTVSPSLFVDQRVHKKHCLFTMKTLTGHPDPNDTLPSNTSEDTTSVKVPTHYLSTNVSHLQRIVEIHVNIFTGMYYMRIVHLISTRSHNQIQCIYIHFTKEIHFISEGA